MGSHFYDLLAEDGTVQQAAAVCVEEIDGFVPGHIPFRFGYVLTAHTAQGSEWDAVYISLPELLAYRAARRQEYKLWAYTALTRARDRVYLLRSHELNNQVAVSVEAVS